MKENIIPATSAIIGFCLPYSILAFTGPESVIAGLFLFLAGGGLAAYLIRELFKIHNTIVKNDGK